MGRGREKQKTNTCRVMEYDRETERHREGVCVKERWCVRERETKRKEETKREYRKRKTVTKRWEEGKAKIYFDANNFPSGELHIQVVTAYCEFTLKAVLLLNFERHSI